MREGWEARGLGGESWKTRYVNHQAQPAASGDDVLAMLLRAVKEYAARVGLSGGGTDAQQLRKGRSKSAYGPSNCHMSSIVLLSPADKETVHLRGCGRGAAPCVRP